jgi:hypothetical protein
VSGPGAQWPRVFAGLLALPATLPAFADVVTFDGQPVTNDAPEDWFTVGFVTDDGAGSYQQAPDPSGVATQEVGEVRCHLACNTGDGDPSITRDRAFALVAALQGALEADPTLGGHVTAQSSVVSVSTQVMAVQNSQGSASSLLVTVHYQTVTYFNP